jgi:cytochrome P450
MKERLSYSEEKDLSSKSSVTLLSHLVSKTSDERIIRDELLNILLAGRDTTASLLSSVIYELARKPAVLKKLREEILRFCGQDGDIDAEIVKEMRFLRAVLNETLRMYPVSL